MGESLQRVDEDDAERRQPGADHGQREKHDGQQPHADQARQHDDQ